MEADFTRSLIDSAVQSLEQSSEQLGPSLENLYERIGIAFNAARKEIDTAMRVIMVAIAKEREASTAASSALMGSTGMVADSLVLVEQADQDLVKYVQQLNMMKSDLDDLVRESLNQMSNSLSDVRGKVDSAASYLRGYATTL